MKLKKTLLAGATAASVALAGTGIASAEEGPKEPSGSSQIISSLQDGDNQDALEGATLVFGLVAAAAGAWVALQNIDFPMPKLPF